MKYAIRLLILTIALSGCLHAQMINGRFVTSAYGWERQLQNGESSSHLRAYENITLNLGTADISFHTYLQGSTDLSTEATDDPELRLFNAYLRVNNLADMIDLKIGRQPLFAGVSYGTIDGASVKVRPTDGVELMTYAGGLTRPTQDLDYYFLDHVENNWQIGGQVLLYLIPDTKIGLSYMNRHRETSPFYAWRPDAQMDLQQTLIDYGSRANQYASVNIAHGHKDLWLYGRYDYDFNFERTARAELSATYQASQKLGITLQLAHREPVIAYNSYFSIFEMSANQEAELGVDYYYSKHIAVLGRVSAISFEDEEAYRVSLGASAWNTSIMYTKDVSYDGDLDGFNLQFVWPFLDNKLLPNLGLVYSTYALSDDLAKSSSTWAGVIGAMYRPYHALSIDLQGQYLTNKIYQSDSRILVRISYWFAETFGNGR